MRRVVFNQKGGVGKSTITCNLAAIAAKEQRKTLVIDLDSQSNTTHYLMGAAANKISGTMADLYSSILTANNLATGLAPYIHATPFPYLDLIPASSELESLHTKLESRYKIYKLRELLLELSNYELIFIDTPPAMNFYTRSALVAAEACLVPFDCDDFSRRALYALLENVREIQADHNPELYVEGIVINQFQPQARLPQQLVQALIEEGLPVIPHYLSSSIKIRESHEAAMPMIHFAPKHKLTQEWLALYKGLKNNEMIKKTQALCLEEL
jgi:chromosome partitioning protein